MARKLCLKVEKECLICKKLFFVWVHREKTAKYCSLECRYKSQSKLIGEKNYNWKGTAICPTCGSYKKHNAKQCQKCYLSKRIGDNHPSWKGGLLKNNGYIYILNHQHPSSDNKGYIARTHLIAEKIINRFLKKSEVIHHINGIKNDDRPENLYLFSSQSNHIKFHVLKNKPSLKSNLTKDAQFWV